MDKQNTETPLSEEFGRQSGGVRARLAKLGLELLEPQQSPS